MISDIFYNICLGISFGEIVCLIVLILRLMKFIYFLEFVCVVLIVGLCRDGKFYILGEVFN